MVHDRSSEPGLLLKSGLIHMRIVRPEDIDYIVALEQDIENAPFINHCSSEKHLAALQDTDQLHLIIENTAGKPVGFVMMAGLENKSRCIELRRIAIADKGQGYGREALRMLKRYAFLERRCHRLWLDVKEGNMRARKLYQSEGFVEEGMLRECDLYEGVYHSMIIMSILENEYQEQINSGGVD